MMKRTLIAAFITLALPVLLFAQQAEPIALPEVPTAPGTMLITEVNLTDNDILGMIKQAIPAFVRSAEGSKGEFGDFLKNADLTTFIDAFQDVHTVRAMQFRLNASTTPASVMSFYQGKFGAEGGWSRVLYDASTLKKGTVAVYARDSEDFLLVGTDSAKKVAYAVRTVGFVDVPKLASWAGNAMKYFSAMEAKKAPAPKKPVPAKKPAAKPVPVKK
jgi:hypothetical protein